MYKVIDSQHAVKAVKVVNLDNANETIVEGYKNEIKLLRRLQYCDKVIKMYDRYVYWSYGKCSKILNTFLILFSNKMLVIRAGIHRMFVRIVNREDPDQTASSEAF